MTYSENMYLKGLLQRQARDSHWSDSRGFNRETLEATWRRLCYASTMQRKTTQLLKRVNRPPCANTERCPWCNIKWKEKWQKSSSAYSMLGIVYNIWFCFCQCYTCALYLHVWIHVYRSPIHIYVCVYMYMHVCVCVCVCMKDFPKLLRLISSNQELIMKVRESLLFYFI